MTGNNPLPAHIRRDIVERTDGIPLFVEEMTKAVLEAESEGDAQRTVAACPSSNALGESELFRDGGSGSFEFEFRRLSIDVAIVAV